MSRKFKRTFEAFPTSFWALIGAAFIDRLGGALLYPFIALYLTDRFGVGFKEVGILFAFFAAAHTLGNIIGGALTDKVGRRWVIILGLASSGLVSLGLGTADTLSLFYALSFLAGFTGSLAGPAQQAMVADLLPAEQRAEGYGIQRIQLNLAVAIGPMLGGLLAGQSYLYLFIADAVTSLVTAVIVYFILPESKPATNREQRPTSSRRFSLGGYRSVLADSAYLVFLLVSMLLLFVYMQSTTTLPVYLRDFHNVSAQGYGYLLSLNAAMVVLLQFWVTRRVSGYAPFVVMAVGAMLVCLGIGLFGFVSGFGLFAVAVIIFTIGEIVMAPVGQSLVTQFAPEEMRGRYLALFEISSAIPVAIGPYLAGFVMETFNPTWLWMAAFPLGLAVVAGYLALDVFQNRQGVTEQKTLKQYNNLETIQNPS